MNTTGQSSLFGQRNLICLLLAIVTFALYWQVRHFEFINFDDDLYVSSNTVVQKGLTLNGVAWAFGSFVAGNWHPVTMLSHMLDCEVFGNSAGAHHLTNVLLHAANAVLVFLLLHSISGALWRSAFVAGLFAWHPLHVESVAWISERKDVLSAFFGLLSLWAYAAYVRESKIQSSKSKVWYGLALALFTLGLMSKSMLVTWPFVMLLLDVWPLQRRSGPRPSSAFRLWLEKIPFFVLSAATCVVTVIAQRASGAMDVLDRVPLALRLANAIVAYVRYLAKTFWPADLGLLYPHPGHWPVAVILGAALLLIAISAAAFVQRRRQPWLAVGWCWFLGTLVPVIGLVQVGRQSMADRYTYLPLIGIFVAAVWCVAELCSAHRWRWLQAGVGVAVLSLSASIAAKQASHWQNSATIFAHTIKVTNANPVAQYAYAQALTARGEWSRAVPHYNEVLRLRPDYFPARINLGGLLLQSGDLAGATNHLGYAVNSRPTNNVAHYYFALALAGLNQWAQAEREFETAHSLGTTNAHLLDRWGDVLVAREKPDAAVARWHECLALEPDSVEVLTKLAWLRATHSDDRLRDGKEALQLASRACELTDYQKPMPLRALAAALAETGEFEAAQKTAMRAITLAEQEKLDELAGKNRTLLRVLQSKKPFRE